MEKQLCLREVLEIIDDSNDDFSDFSDVFDEVKLTMILITYKKF